ncbi:MAG: EAL domain-containing response regulator [Pseudomonadota bacterium]
MASKTLLILDDQVSVAELVADVAEGCDVKPEITNTFEHFQKKLAAYSPDFIILDLVMPGVDGVEVLRFLSQKKCQADIILMSGCDQKVLNTARTLGRGQGLSIIGTLQKPINIDDLEGFFTQEKDVEPTLTAEDLTLAISRKEIVPFYQPKIDIRDPGLMGVKGVEALARWHHPTRGLLHPDVIIPLAEEHNLMHALTRTMIDEVLQDMAQWQGVGLDMLVAINIAPTILTDLHLPDRFAEKTALCKIPNNRIILEITEDAAMEDRQRISDILTRFRLKGFQLSLDDFGTGYSSLTDLYRMPFTEIKIDRSFVMDIMNSDEARTINRSIVDLGHNLNLSVCAEGAETQAAVDYLRKIGCDTVQGFFFAKPLPRDEIIKFIESFEGRNITNAA